MRTKIIDVSSFDQDEDTKGTRVVYGFTEEQLANPLATIQAFVADPAAFKEGEYRAILTHGQDQRLQAYLRKGEPHYRRTSFQSDKIPRYLLAFSFGENPDVNMQLATSVERAISRLDSLRVFVQWEIANILCERNGQYRKRVSRIDFDCDRDYITSIEVVEKFKSMIPKDDGVTLLLVCQAWHAPRCILTCEDRGLRVVQGEFVDEFSPSDPQKWVRNWLAWVLKEGTKK